MIRAENPRAINAFYVDSPKIEEIELRLKSLKQQIFVFFQANIDVTGKRKFGAEPVLDLRRPTIWPYSHPGVLKSLES